MQNVIDNEVQAPEVHVYRFEGLDNILEAHKRIRKANDRLEKAGIEDRFEAVNIVSGEFEMKKGDYPFQSVQMVDFEEFELNFPKIGYEGWNFVASVSFEEGGTLVNAVPGQSLIGWERPEAHLCEHCNLKRHRKASYVLKNEDSGEFMQIGSSCLTLFLGIAPALWAVGFELPQPEASDFSRYEEMFDIRNWLALTLAVTDGGAGFVSRGKARGNEDLTASVDDATSVFYPHHRLMARDQEYAAWIGEMQAETVRILSEEQDHIDAIIESGKAVGQDSDYGMNLAVVLNSESVTRRSLGLLSSVVGVHHRNVEREAERKANPSVKGFLGEVKERLRGMKVTVTGMKYIEGHYGVTTLVSMRAESGHEVRWFASGVKEFEIGQELVADFTIKAHEEFNGTDQTMVTRLTVKS